MNQQTLTISADLYDRLVAEAQYVIWLANWP
jgi:hypothetical protein